MHEGPAFVSQQIREKKSFWIRNGVLQESEQVVNDVTVVPQNVGHELRLETVGFGEFCF